jgi:hypothetical protein
MSLVLIQPPPARSGAVLEKSGVFAQIWSGWFRKLYEALNANFSSIQSALPAGYSGTVALAKLTTGGSNGSLTVSNGLITAYTPPS